MTPSSDDRLLLYVPAPIFRHEGQLYVEDQAHIGLRHWAANFAHVDVMSPTYDAVPPRGWSAAAALDDVPGLTLHDLPAAYSPLRFFRVLPAVRARIMTLIAKSSYCSFAIGGLFGDWGAIAGFAAEKMNRPFAIWTDRVESEVMRLAARNGSAKERLRARLYYRPMALLEKSVISRATVGLFHGAETYAHYAPMARQADLVHDILVDKADHIPPEALAAKQAGAADGPLRIFYAGRVDPMKGPLDWVAALAGLRAQGIPFDATWMGDGPEMAQMRAAIASAGLEEHIRLPGFVTDRTRVLAEMRAAQVFLFCHKTPESPRNLIEALFSGTPLVGYDGAYARDLIQNTRGGRLSPIGDTQALTATLAGLAQDRAALSDLIGAAYACGAGFDVESVFRHRSELIRRYLG